MNIDTAKTAILSSSEMTTAASSTQAKRFSGSSTSFESEMKASQKEEVETSDNIENAENSEKKEENSKTEKKETKKEDKVSDKVSKEKEADNTQTLKGEVSASNQQNQNGEQNQNQQNQNAYSALSDQVQAYMNANGGNFNFTNVNPMGATTRGQISGMKTSVDYTSIQMSDTDAKFFADLVSKTDMSMGSIASEFQKALQQGNTKAVQSTAKATAALIEALKESSQTNQPFRIDFDKDVSVILQVDRSGKINANFIPGDKAVENYLRNNIDFLRQRFDEENIAYGDLNYSQSRRQRDEQERRNNKESGNE